MEVEEADPTNDPPDDRRERFCGACGAHRAKAELQLRTATVTRTVRAGGGAQGDLGG